ncbi:Gfo/Idh/MocA family protein [Paracoccus sp. SCSIO 75233]|uniref:Gfo/Idh/MocA family protein n=1 Tax=Paracoccus sp. SCSIO 75233 TaxID=3017782 RepID=UPI0022F1282C|nr:Gfo/Idh/MocA family oxidoreductase [Paracoccus sp. SCSIO 75233]WBU52027.1 Gfo/Idh/MocA family oxidoreductase [Paracoccus sp. SCSIO 75233]
MTVRLAMVGCGRISHAHGIAADRIGRETVRFVACSDINPDNARKFAETYGCDAHYGDPSEMYAAGGFDGVVLATWPAQHLQQVSEALDAGIRYILCEKSLATSAEDAAEIWRRANAAGATVIEGFMYLHHPLIKKLEERLASGDAGPIDWVRSTSSFYFPEVADGADQTRSWRFRKNTGGGVPWDLLCYPVNACGRYAGSLPMHVSANGTFSEKYGTVNRIFGTIAYEDDRFGVVESSACAMFSQELEIHGRERVFRIDTVFTPPGDAKLDELHAPKFSHVNQTSHEIPSKLPLQDDLPSYPAYRDQLEHFLAVMGDDAVAPLPSLTHSAINVAVIEALVESLESGGNRVEVKIADDLRAAWQVS